MYANGIDAITLMHSLGHHFIFTAGKCGPTNVKDDRFDRSYVLEPHVLPPTPAAPMLKL